jgi:subtilisin family serine protease
MQPEAAYIMLPVESNAEIDRVGASDKDDFGNAKDPDGTKPKDGWATFSGTSAAAPQLAGVCALLLQKNPGLTPAEVKAVLRRTCRDVINGTANDASNEGVPVTAGTGTDGATGTGLVDAFAAWQQV